MRFDAFNAALVALATASYVTFSGATEIKPVIPAADFFRNDSFANATMSPSGKYIAAAIKSNPKERRGLVVFDTYDLSKSKIIAQYADADVTDITWINDDRLSFDSYDLNVVVAEQGWRPVHAIDREGKKQPRNLKWGNLHSVLNDGSNDAIFVRGYGDYWSKNRSSGLMRIDTVTGEEKNITFGAPESIHSWALDRRGNPRIALATIDGKSRMYWRIKADAPWTIAREWNTYANLHESPTPIAVDDQDRAYIIAREGGADENALYRVDMQGDPNKWQPIVSLNGYDFNGSLIWGKDGRLLGVRHMTDAYSTSWIDPEMKQIQASVDKLLSTTSNTISCGLCADRRKILVYSWSDRQPGVTLLYDVETKAVQVLGRERPWIQPNTMARREMVRVTARDGLTIPVHVTRPTGQKEPAPMVVLVHGGPFVRGGTWQWDSESQFLASRGFVVVEPEFRGSFGFGYKHFHAGWKQWGLAMQDDVADATQWAIKQEYADPKRICIAGASYGGYAALMGLVRYGDMYQCAVSWAAVSDIDLIYEARWSNLPEKYRQFGMPILIADQDKDAAQIRDTSPLRQAKKIKRPVLLAHGGEDYRVPIYAAVKMRNALEKNGTPVEWIAYKSEGHGWQLEENLVDFWTKVETFLKKHTVPR